jgi:hypothetical protein
LSGSNLRERQRRRKKRRKRRMDKLEKEVQDVMGLEPAPAPSAPPIEEPPAPAPVVEPPAVSIEEPPPLAAAQAAPAPSDTPVAAPIDGPPPAAPATPAPPPAAPPAPQDPKDAELAALKQTVQELRTVIEATAKQAIRPPSTPVETPVQIRPDGKPVQAQPPALKFIEKEEDLDQALNSVDNFNSLLTKVVEKTRESMLLAVPQLVGKLADQVVTQRMAVQEFYNNNRDLVGNKAFVGMVANEIAASHPEWQMDQVLTVLADEVRKKLALSGIAVHAPPVAPQAPPVAPAFVPGGPSRPSAVGAPPIDKLAAEVSDLLSGL